jgi:hypothetical protein
MAKTSHKVLVLRGNNEDNSSPHDPSFIYPKKGKVVAPKWDPAPECGRGLHGFAWGTGDGGLLNTGGIYQIISVDPKDIVNLGSKVKFKKGEVVLTTENRDEAIQYLLDNGAKGLPVMFSTNTVGINSVNTGGYCSTNTGGYGSKNTGGYNSVNTGGNESKNTGGGHSKNTGGNHSTNTGGNYSKNTGENGSINTGENGSKNTGGDDSTNTGGNYSINTGGDGSKCQGGVGSVLSIQWYDGKRMRVSTAYVGEKKILPDVMYRLDSKGKFITA